MSALLTWVLAASTLLAPQRPHDELAEAITNRVEAESPLFKGDDDRRKTSALLLAIAFRESSLRASATGDSVGGKPTSFCAFQIHLPGGAKTAEGFTGAELAEDPDKCVTTAIHMLRASMQQCPAHPLAYYASGPAGCANERAQRISRDRLAIAQRLIRDVRVNTQETASKSNTDAMNDSSADVSTTSVAVRPPSTLRPRLFCGGA
jgi:hypothetical protein